ncbi:hypothetical protein WMY93_024773 [Mugilogobius chulae]|uniref:Fibronectin type-III domain-containing protein n=1 Tax=Mugilogobius chulae TaxID=88201 RepID=A0AAW0N3V7_9GOBI
MVKLGPNNSHVVITDMQPFVCYEGAVYVFFSKNSVDRLEFTDVNTAVKVPTTGPFVEERVEGTTVNVSWLPLTLSQRGGCITKYTLYLKQSSKSETTTSYIVSASQKFWVLRDLTPGAYSVWMTASTAKGESKPGQKVNFFIQHESQVVLILILAILFFFLVLLLCACQITDVNKSVLLYSQYCLPDIPDPKNSKWAKDFLKEKGQSKVSLHLQLSTSTPEFRVRVFTPLYPHITYIKSLSHDSDSSGHTQTSSLDTSETAGYISSHGTATMSEEDEDNGEFSPFFPSHSFLSEQLDFGQKLTLDAVRIDGTDFFL